MKKQTIYNDIGFNFEENILTHDVSTVINDQAVKDSVLNLLLTNKRERLYKPTVGSDISSLLFENVDILTAHQIKRNIQITLKNEEPRVKVNYIEVIPVPDNNEFIVTVSFYIHYNINKLQTLEFSLTSQQG